MPSRAERIAGQAETLAQQVVALGTELGVRIAVAESLTGGLVAATLVAVPGASQVLSGGIVAYDTALKASLLAVDRDLLRRTGPVDRAVAEQMASGVRVACAVPEGASLEDHSESAGERQADVGVATTGVAGPDPDPQTGQPAGTVWIGVSSRLGDRAESPARISGDRGVVRAESVLIALELVLEELQLLRESRP